MSGTVIHEPTPVPVPSLVPLAQLDGPGRDGQQQAAALFEAYQEKVKAYRRAADDARDIFKDWDKALTGAISDWSMDDTKLALKVGSLMVSAAGAGVKLRLSPQLARQAAEHMDLARSARRTAYEMLNGKLPFSQQAYDDLIGWGRHAQNSADDLLASSRNPDTPKRVKALGHGVGVLGAGYGAYYDMNHGESTEQAVASNAGGLLAGTAAGAAAGAAAGSIVPVGGTLVGLAWAPSSGPGRRRHLGGHRLRVRERRRRHRRRRGRGGRRGSATSATWSACEVAAPLRVAHARPASACVFRAQALRQPRCVQGPSVRRPSDCSRNSQRAWARPGRYGP